MPSIGFGARSQLTVCVMQKLPMMFLRREEQCLGVVEQLSPLLDRHYRQIDACHGGITQCLAA